jgi:hypothetical protein
VDPIGPDDDPGPWGELESGVRTAVALLVREIQHSVEYRENGAPDDDQTRRGDGPHDAWYAQKITRQQRAASERWIDVSVAAEADGDRLQQRVQHD